MVNLFIFGLFPEKTSEISVFGVFSYFFLHLFLTGSKGEEEETLGDLKKELELDVHKITVEELCRRLGKQV